jgi:hypothetical protein
MKTSIGNLEINSEDSHFRGGKKEKTKDHEHQKHQEEDIRSGLDLLGIHSDAERRQRIHRELHPRSKKTFADFLGESYNREVKSSRRTLAGTTIEANNYKARYYSQLKNWEFANRYDMYPSASNKFWMALVEAFIFVLNVFAIVIVAVLDTLWKGLVIVAKWTYRMIRDWMEERKRQKALIPVTSHSYWNDDDALL